MMRRSLVLTVCSTVLSGCIGLEDPELVEWRSEAYADELEGVDEPDALGEDELDAEDREDAGERLVTIGRDVDEQTRGFMTEGPNGSVVDAEDGAPPEQGSSPSDEPEELADTVVAARSWGSGSAIRPSRSVSSGGNSNTDCAKLPDCVSRD